MNEESLEEHPIIFFDGVCGMCNTFADIIIRDDRKALFRFAPIQGETAKEYLPPFGDDPAEWSVIYQDEAGTHDQSDAALRIAQRLGGLWAVLGWLRIVPRFIRNPVYRLIARNRYRIFGKREACRIPTEAERARFLP